MHHIVALGKLTNRENEGSDKKLLLKMDNNSSSPVLPPSAMGAS
jgi:hypothetical protein